MLIAVSTDGRPPCSIDIARSGGHDSAISATSIGNSCRLGSPARRKLAPFYRGFRGIPDMKGLVLFSQLRLRWPPRWARHRLTSAFSDSFWRARVAGPIIRR